MSGMVGISQDEVGAGTFPDMAPGVSQINMVIHVNSDSQHIVVWEVLYCPMIAHNLLSVPQLTHAGAQAHFFNSSCQLFDGSEKLIAVAHLKDSLYQLLVLWTVPWEWGSIPAGA